ncbi:MAG: hypothetical protein CMJ18_13980 [Phycisphaeraceae bacterium]|nr:hypothetical protein [Phycisphaeraceae bacterium]
MSHTVPNAAACIILLGAVTAPVRAGEVWASPAELRGKKLIECGHGYMDPAVENFPRWMARHPHVMSAYPFDGVCLRVWVEGRRQYLDDFCMSGAVDVTDQDVADTIAAYNEVQWGSLTDNFLYWFLRHGNTAFADPTDPMQRARVVHNARLMAKVARACGFKGIWLDPEPYEGNPFAGAPAAAVRQLGREWIEAVQSELPEAVILVLFMYSPDQISKDFSDFMNGMVAGITGKGRIVHTYENSMYYGMSKGMRFGEHAGDRARWQTYRDNVKIAWRTRCNDPARYDRFVEVGAGTWWESEPNGWPGWPWPEQVARSNLPLALATSDEYAYCWNEHTNFYRTLPDRLDPWIASTTNKTLNRGTEQVAALLEDFQTDPLTRGWYFDFDVLNHENHEAEKPFAFRELPYIGSGRTGWHPNHQSLKIAAHRCGTQRHRYVHPVKPQTHDASFFGSIDFQISEFSTDPNNPMVMGLFNAERADDAGALTLQVWDANTVKVQLAGESGTVTLAPELAHPLTRGPVYRFLFRHDVDAATLHASLQRTEPDAVVFDASASTKEAGSFAMDEYGVAMWNIDETVTDPATACQYRVRMFALNRSSGGIDEWATPLELRGKKLIECGHGNRWSGITPQWMAENPKIMSAYPFDGLTLRIYLDPEWCRAHGIDPVVTFRELPGMHNQAPFLAQLCMSGKHDVPDSAVQGTIDAYRKVKWGSLTDNFLDWTLRHGDTHFAKLDDDTEWNRVLNNARLMGRVAAECGFKGVWLDTEDYSGSPFKGYDADLVKRRGRQWIEALQAELPEVVLIFTFVYDDSGYAARFNDFMNGILAGIIAKGRIVNAYENSFYYGWSDGMPRGAGWGPISGDRAKYGRCRDNVINRWRSQSDDPARYDRYVEVGMAAWWDGKDNLSPGQPSPYGWSNLPLALATSDEYVWCWNEFSSWYLTLPLGRLDPRVASSTNMTLNQGTEQAIALDFDFSSNPLLNSNGWYFDYDALDHDAHSPFEFAELPYNWSKDERTLIVHAHRRGEQRHRYVHPIRTRTRTDEIRGSFDFRIDRSATHGDNVIVMGLFDAGEADDAGSLTLQVWDMNMVRVQLVSQRGTVTLEPVLNGPLVTGEPYRFTFQYDPDRSTLETGLRGIAQPGRRIFHASASARSLGDFSLDEFGVALWNAGEVSTPRTTAWAYRLFRATLDAP